MLPVSDLDAASSVILFTGRLMEIPSVLKSLCSDCLPDSEAYNTDLYFVALAIGLLF